MARMIPDIDLGMIENDGERLLYEALRRLPADYTVLYSYKFIMQYESDDPGFSAGEIDFVIVHPSLGYATIEVKQGEIAYFNGIWQEHKNGDYIAMRKDPVAQAQKAIYAILDRYKEVSHTESFPLKIRYAVSFPECTSVAGMLPAHLTPEGVILAKDLDNIEEKIDRLFGGKAARRQSEAVKILLDKVLSPSFRAFARLEEQIGLFETRAKRALTDEQERILEETELDKRKVFLGAAGTGKTFVAMEKARRLDAAGRKVFFTCFNKNLADYLRRNLPPTITIGNFHEHLVHALERAGGPLTVPDDDDGRREFFDETLPALGFEYYAESPDEARFDSIIVDEGQDFREGWFICLESMLRGDGEFFVFADPNQNLFGSQVDCLKRMPVSKHRLTRNLRNAQTISEWISSFVRDGDLKPVIRGGIPVIHHAWESPAEEKRLVENEVGRLVSQGIQPGRVLILSPNRQDNSSLAGVTKIKDWPLVDFKTMAPNAVRFSTIRSFKGLESDIVFLISLREGSRSCTEADIYVGGSRARYILHTFYDRNNPPKSLAIVMNA
jgi:hypothetical protein